MVYDGVRENDGGIARQVSSILTQIVGKRVGGGWVGCIL